jgi:hypothetical protein
LNYYYRYNLPLAPSARPHQVFAADQRRLSQVSCSKLQLRLRRVRLNSAAANVLDRCFVQMLFVTLPPIPLRVNVACSTPNFSTAPHVIAPALIRRVATLEEQVATFKGSVRWALAAGAAAQHHSLLV